MASTRRRENESAQQIDEAQQLFLDLYGVPFSWALQMSAMDSDLGKHWKGVLEHLNDITQEEIVG